jgi:hypothetical protein
LLFAVQTVPIALLVVTAVVTVTIGIVLLAVGIVDGAATTTQQYIAERGAQPLHDQIHTQQNKITL